MSSSQNPATQHPNKENMPESENPQHRAVQEQKLEGEKMQQASYISPSDTIMSPATQKLAAFKTKHMGKGLKPQTLFAKTVTNQANISGARPPQSSKSLFADVGSNTKPLDDEK